MWASEDQMVGQFVETLSVLPRKRNNKVLVWREVSTQYGRPDVVVVEYSPEVSHGRRQLGMATEARFPTKAAYAMSYLAGCRWVKIETLRAQLSYPNAEFNRVLGELRGRGLIWADGERLRAAPRTECLAVRRLWVFEAKLDKWQVAVDQAERHLWFTWDSYILLPSACRSDAVSLECERRGVGFSTYSPDDGLCTRVRAAKKGFSNSPLLWTINEAVIGGANVTV